VREFKRLNLGSGSAEGYGENQKVSEEKFVYVEIESGNQVASQQRAWRIATPSSWLGAAEYRLVPLRFCGWCRMDAWESRTLLALWILTEASSWQPVGERVHRIVQREVRDELLDGEIFDTLLEAKVLIERWRVEYNTIRPHSVMHTGISDLRFHRSASSGETGRSVLQTPGKLFAHRGAASWDYSTLSAAKTGTSSP
jgi:hypothetical protein